VSPKNKIKLPDENIEINYVNTADNEEFIRNKRDIEGI